MILKAVTGAHIVNRGGGMNSKRNIDFFDMLVPDVF